MVDSDLLQINKTIAVAVGKTRICAGIPDLCSQQQVLALMKTATQYQEEQVELLENINQRATQYLISSDKKKYTNF